MVSLRLDLPSPSLQAQVTPAPQPSASLTTNHLVLITRKFSPPPFSPSPPSPPPAPLSSCPTVRPSLCQGPANFILIGHRLGRGNDLPHCLHPSVHPVSASHLTSFLLPARASRRSLCNFALLFVFFYLASPPSLCFGPPPSPLYFFYSPSSRHMTPAAAAARPPRPPSPPPPVCCRCGSGTMQLWQSAFSCNFSC